MNALEQRRLLSGHTSGLARSGSSADMAQQSTRAMEIQCALMPIGQALLAAPRRWKTPASAIRDPGLTGFGFLWTELFPAEQARIVRLLVERVDVLEVRLRAEGLASLVAELRLQPAPGRAA